MTQHKIWQKDVDQDCGGNHQFLYFHYWRENLGGISAKSRTVNYLYYITNHKFTIIFKNEMLRKLARVVAEIR